MLFGQVFGWRVGVDVFEGCNNGESVQRREPDCVFVKLMDPPLRER